MQGMAAACVGPHCWERDFCAGPLLQQELVLGVEQEHAEGSVQLTLRLSSIEPMYVILAGMSGDAVTVINNNALIFVHKLLLCAFACIHQRHDLLNCLGTGWVS